MWLPNDRFAFFEHMAEYWPGSLGAFRAGEETRIMKLWEEQVGEYPLSVALEALKDLKRTEQVTRVPTMGRVRKACEEVRKKHGAGQGSTRRQILIARLAVLSQEGARWVSPKGRDCRIRADGLEYVDEHKLRRTLPWGFCETKDLEQILRFNEREVLRPDSEDARLETWREFLATDGPERCIERLEAAKEPRAAGWLRGRLPHWRAGRASIFTDLAVPPPIETDDSVPF